MNTYLSCGDFKTDCVEEALQVTRGVITTYRFSLTHVFRLTASSGERFASAAGRGF
jgi:hypothetical protein